MNRREALTGMALASAAITLPALALAEARPDRCAWDKAFVALQAAHKTSDDAEGPLWRIEKAYQAAIKEVPHITVDVSGRQISTDNRYEVSSARSSAKGLRYVETCAYADVKARQQLVDAADLRDAQIAAIDQRLGRSAANNHYDALSEAIGDAEEVLLKMPAPDGEALLWKVNRLYAEGEGMWEAGYESQTHADLRRLLTSKVEAWS